MLDLAKFGSDLREGADRLRANSKLTASDHFMPAPGVIFLRHAACFLRDLPLPRLVSREITV